MKNNYFKYKFVKDFTMKQAERHVAAKYLTVLNMGERLSNYSVKEIESKFNQLNDAVYLETDGTHDLEDEFLDWYENLDGVTSWAYIEWCKVRDKVEGL